MYGNEKIARQPLSLKSEMRRQIWSKQKAILQKSNAWFSEAEREFEQVTGRKVPKRPELEFVDIEELSGGDGFKGAAVFNSQTNKIGIPEESQVTEKLRTEVIHEYMHYALRNVEGISKEIASDMHTYEFQVRRTAEEALAKLFGVYTAMREERPRVDALLKEFESDEVTVSGLYSMFSTPIEIFAREGMKSFIEYKLEEGRFNSAVLKDMPEVFGTLAVFVIMNVEKDAKTALKRLFEMQLQDPETIEKNISEYAKKFIAETHS